MFLVYAFDLQSSTNTTFVADELTNSTSVTEIVKLLSQGYNITASKAAFVADKYPFQAKMLVLGIASFDFLGLAYGLSTFCRKRCGECFDDGTDDLPRPKQYILEKDGSKMIIRGSVLDGNPVMGRV